MLLYFSNNIYNVLQVSDSIHYMQHTYIHKYFLTPLNMPQNAKCLLIFISSDLPHKLCLSHGLASHLHKHTQYGTEEYIHASEFSLRVLDRQKLIRITNIIIILIMLAYKTLVNSLCTVYSVYLLLWAAVCTHAYTSCGGDI